MQIFRPLPMMMMMISNKSASFVRVFVCVCARVRPSLLRESLLASVLLLTAGTVPAPSHFRASVFITSKRARPTERI